MDKEDVDLQEDPDELEQRLIGMMQAMDWPLLWEQLLMLRGADHEHSGLYREKLEAARARAREHGQDLEWRPLYAGGAQMHFVEGRRDSGGKPGRQLGRLESMGQSKRMLQGYTRAEDLVPEGQEGDQHGARVLVRGDAGSGKTTLLKHMAYMWAAGEGKPGACWRRFDLVLLVPLPELRGTGSTL